MSLPICSRRDRLEPHRCSECFGSIRTPVQEDKVCKNIMSTIDLIMSILAEKPMNLMSWNVTQGKCGSHNGRDVLMLPVSGFKHQGIVAIYPNSLQGYFDIDLVNKDNLIVESVEYISACKLSEIIDQLVEVTEHYFDDIDRWLAQCPPDKYQLQKMGRMAKRFPDLAAKFPLKMGFVHK